MSKQAVAEYIAAIRQIWADYDAATEDAREAHNRTFPHTRSWAAYDAAVAPARKDYNAAYARAWDKYRGPV